MTGRYHSITTSDGVTIRYLDVGTGRPLVLIPGGLQTAAQFRKQLEFLSATFRVVAVDMRGHGESDKPAHGYRIARFAKDLHDLLTQLDLNDVALLGHSMGCSIIWSYWDLFAGERLERLILVDQPPRYFADLDDNSIQAPDSLGMAASGLFECVDSIAASDQGEAMTSRLDGGWLTEHMTLEDRAFFAEQIRRFPRREHAFHLLTDQFTQDWRDVLSRIDVPTLIIGGVLFPHVMEWVANQIPVSRLELFTVEECGSHFMFWENPEKFNRLVQEFTNSSDREW